MTDKTMVEYYTPENVSEILHICMKKTYKLFKMRGFPSVKIGRQWLVEAGDLKKFLAEYKGSGIIL